MNTARGGFRLHRACGGSGRPHRRAARFPPNDLKEFVAYVKANSDKLNMAHAGVGSITHFTCLLLNSVIGANPAMIPFNG